MSANLEKIKERILASKLEKVIRDYSNEKIVQINQEILTLYHNEVEELKKLFNNIEKDVNFREEGKTPLYTAIKEDYRELIKYLIDNGADLNNINDENQRALNLIQDLVRENIDNESPLHPDWYDHNVEVLGESADNLTTDINLPTLY